MTEHHRQSAFHTTKRQRLLLLGALFVGSGIYLGVQLDMMGAAGEHHAQVWDFIIALFGIAGSVATAILQVTQHRGSHDIAHDKAAETDARQPVFTPVIVLTSVGIALLAFAIPGAISKYAFTHWQQEAVTVKLQQASELQDGSTALVTLPGSKHTRLDIGFTLSSLISSGSCVSPAKLTVTPTYNGNDEPSLPVVRSGESQQITLHTGPKPQLRIHIDLSAEPTCRVKLHVARATYSQ